jgi:hypothetical protein
MIHDGTNKVEDGIGSFSTEIIPEIRKFEL